MRGAYCACTLASVSVRVRWDVNCVSVFGFQGRSQVSQREGSAPWECMCVAEHTCSHTETVSTCLLVALPRALGPTVGKSNFRNRPLVCSRVRLAEGIPFLFQTPADLLIPFTCQTLVLTAYGTHSTISGQFNFANPR